MSSATPFRQVIDDLTCGCGCACHVGTGYNTSCAHCWVPATNVTIKTLTLNGELMQNTSGSKLVGVPFCPDLLRYEDIGAADNMRGRVVRAFFWLMRWWR